MSSLLWCIIHFPTSLKVEYKSVRHSTMLCDVIWGEVRWGEVRRGEARWGIKRVKRDSAGGEERSSETGQCAANLKEGGKDLPFGNYWCIHVYITRWWDGGMLHGWQWETGKATSKLYNFFLVEWYCLAPEACWNLLLPVIPAFHNSLKVYFSLLVLVWPCHKMEWATLSCPWLYQCFVVVFVVVVFFQF